VTATGTGITYQWRKGTVNLTNGGNISGANSPTLTINPVKTSDVASNYNVVITGICAPNEMSNNVSLEVGAAPSISTVACVGSSVSFSATATGAGLTYQWRNGNVNLTDGGNISGSTSPTLTINPVNISDASPNYNVVITGTCSPDATPLNVALIVNPGTNITTEPTNQTVCAGSSVSFSATATGAGLTYQWRKGTVNLINGGNISGANSPTLTIDPVNISDAASNYNVVVTGTGICTSNDTSNDVSLIVNPTTPTIIIQPENQILCLGCPAIFSVEATGTGLTYQWRRGTVNLVNGGNIYGATSPTLIIDLVTSADVATDYNVVITGPCAPITISKNASLSLCTTTGIASLDAANNNNSVVIYPNPFTKSIDIVVNDISQINNCKLKIYNALGEEVVNTIITEKLTTLKTSNLNSGIYLYKVLVNDKTIKTGKLISKQ
jgi:hypothetical protein